MKLINLIFSVFLVLSLFSAGVSAQSFEFPNSGQLINDWMRQSAEDLASDVNDAVDQAIGDPVFEIVAVRTIVPEEIGPQGADLVVRFWVYRDIDNGEDVMIPGDGRVTVRVVFGDEERVYHLDLAEERFSSELVAKFSIDACDGAYKDLVIDLVGEVPAGDYDFYSKEIVLNSANTCFGYFVNGYPRLSVVDDKLNVEVGVAYTGFEPAENVHIAVAVEGDSFVRVSKNVILDSLYKSGEIVTFVYDFPDECGVQYDLVVEVWVYTLGEGVVPLPTNLIVNEYGFAVSGPVCPVEPVVESGNDHGSADYSNSDWLDDLEDQYKEYKEDYKELSKDYLEAETAREKGSIESDLWRLWNDLGDLDDDIDKLKEERDSDIEYALERLERRVRELRDEIKVLIRGEPLVEEPLVEDLSDVTGNVLGSKVLLDLDDLGVVSKWREVGYLGLLTGSCMVVLGLIIWLLSFVFRY